MVINGAQYERGELLNPIWPQRIVPVSALNLLQRYRIMVTFSIN
jgi:hypothetical protein